MYIITVKGKEVSRHEKEQDARSEWHRLRPKYGTDVKVRKESKSPYMSQASKKDRYKASRDYLMLKTKQSTLPRLDKSRYPQRRGLEGPFMTKSGQVVYYDKKFGQYYNSDTDMYIDYDDWKKMSEEVELSEERYHSMAKNGDYEVTLDLQSYFDDVKDYKYSIRYKGKRLYPIRTTKHKNWGQFEVGFPKGWLHKNFDKHDTAYTIHKKEGKREWASLGGSLNSIVKWFKTRGITEEAPANATGTAVAGTGDDSSTVVVKKKKKLQDKLMRRLKIKEAIDRAIPDLEYPKDEITERKQQLIDMAKKHGENI